MCTPSWDVVLHIAYCLNIVNIFALLLLVCECVYIYREIASIFLDLLLYFKLKKYCCASCQCDSSRPYMQPHHREWNSHLRYFKEKLAHEGASHNKKCSKAILTSRSSWFVVSGHDLSQFKSYAWAEGEPGRLQH